MFYYYSINTNVRLFVNMIYYLQDKFVTITSINSTCVSQIRDTGPVRIKYYKPD